MKIGVIGCGNISGIYYENLYRFDGTEVVACTDLDIDKAKLTADKYRISRVLSQDELLSDPEIELNLNLTVPKAHFDVSFAALQAGKHVYVEKPLAIRLDDGKRLVDLAESSGLTIGCAPDTVLGGGIQTCRTMFDRGDIGDPVGGNAFMLCPGHESWHPAPEFYYENGGGPMFDMGPYYLSAFIALLGPIQSVSAATKTTWAKRTITSQPQSGKEIVVDTPTHIVSILTFANGAVVQFTASFDVQASTLAPIELYGTKGTMLVPDPNGFGDDWHGTPQPIRYRRKGSSDWQEQPLLHGYFTNSRGLGVQDQVQAIAEGRLPRASGQMGLHVLEAMSAMLESGESGKRVEMGTALGSCP
jgi:predicted dehydrogenase